MNSRRFACTQPRRIERRLLPGDEFEAIRLHGTATH
jgi:hypothetical protein